MRSGWAPALWARRSESAIVPLRIDVSFDDDLGVGGDFEVDRLAPDQLDAAAVEEAGEEQFADAGRQRGGGGVGQDALAAEDDRERHVLAAVLSSDRKWRAPSWCMCQCMAMWRGPKSCTRYMPMLRTAGAGVVAVVGVDGVDAAEGDVAAAVFARSSRRRGRAPRDVVVGIGGVADGGEIAVERPAADERQAGEVDLVAGEDDFLADAGADALGRDAWRGRGVRGAFGAWREVSAGVRA